MGDAQTSQFSPLRRVIDFDRLRFLFDETMIPDFFFAFDLDGVLELEADGASSRATLELTGASGVLVERPPLAVVERRPGVRGLIIILVATCYSAHAMDDDDDVGASIRPSCMQLLVAGAGGGCETTKKKKDANGAFVNFGRKYELAGVKG